MYLGVPVVLGGRREQGDDEGQCHGRQPEVDGVTTGLSPGAPALPRLHHHAVTILQLKTEILGVVLERLVPPVPSHKLKVLVRLVTRKVLSSPVGGGCHHCDPSPTWLLGRGP